MLSSYLYHISEDPAIKEFIPRPSPSAFNAIKGDVVFAISEKLLHNYYFPRNCPRVTYYANEHTTQPDKEKFFIGINAAYVLAIEERWQKALQETKLYCYKFLTNDFELLDECAGYYISYKTIRPIAVNSIESPYEIIAHRKDIQLNVLPEIKTLAESVKKSTLAFSLIRMKYAL
ncbi:MAG: hypothetical protein QM726_20150 [Chitinophagaceae bacterium]